jgi:DNA (cytosine-5)-methyltransferase 1
VRPRLLDLFCGAGGAAAGYFRAGFDIVGVDLAPQEHYPFPFHRADAVAFPLDGFDVIHASPPCQSYSHMTNCRPGVAGEYPQLIDVMRKRLSAQGRPWIIENVDGSGLASQDDFFGTHGLMLCGSMFGLELYRHRLFETSFPAAAANHPRHLIPASKAGHWEPGTIISVAGNCAPIKLARQAMGIAWMNRDELAESIPPVYSEYLGLALLRHLSEAAA